MKDINIKKIVDQAVNEMFRGSSMNILNEADTVYTTRAKKDLVNAFQNYYNRNAVYCFVLSFNVPRMGKKSIRFSVASRLFCGKNA